MNALSILRQMVRGFYRPIRTSLPRELEFEYLNNIRINKKFIFVTGMHRSGTTFIARYISTHSHAAGFNNVPGRMDEGQFVQDVFPIDTEFGGMRFFGYHPRSRMTEAGGYNAGEIGVCLLKAWLVYLDRHADVFVEKTPSNFRRSRLLAAAFPRSCFIHIVRHPVATVLALKALAVRSDGYQRRSLYAYMRHWEHCQKQAIHDYRWLQLRGIPVLVIALEDLLTFSSYLKEFLAQSVGLELDMSELGDSLEGTPNRKYQLAYACLDDRGGFFRSKSARIVRMFGYSQEDLNEPPKYTDWIDQRGL